MREVFAESEIVSPTDEIVSPTDGEALDDVHKKLHSSIQPLACFDDS